MNRENILAVADAIEKHSIPDLGFNMWDYVATAPRMKRAGVDDMSGHNCGTVACIAGWARAVKTGTVPLEPFGLHEDAQVWLGLDSDDADGLFYAIGRAPEMSIKDITPSQAVSVLRHLAETGEVDWDRALADPAP